jgi:hypothetical protein
MKSLATVAIFLTTLTLAVQGSCQEAKPGKLVEIDVEAGRVLHLLSRWLTGACLEDVNHEVYGGLYSQMIFGESFQEPPVSETRRTTKVAKEQKADQAEGVSGMWRRFQRGSAAGRFTIVTRQPFAGAQSQSLSFDAGTGQCGIENQGLNRWGMNFAAGKPYEGFIWARAEKPATLFASLESRDGSRTYAEAPLAIAANEWRRFDFTLTPTASDPRGRFALTLKQPGSVTIGYAFLQPGEWGRFHGLPDRRDVAEGLIDQGITVLRYGGSMVNHGEYRWKKMIGPRDRRPPYAGTWYRYSSNGWGILDFMNFCEAAGFEYVPAFNMGESPADMADFVRYVKGPADSDWGRKRAADGHSAPYRLKYVELGNEERVDEKYAARFEALARAIWALDPELILVVGDFAYNQRIRDPLDFRGAASGITTLAGHARILRLARQSGREVWFDVHVDTDRPEKLNPSLDGMFSFADALDKISEGARHKVVVFELNAGNHAQRRGLANALALNAIARDGRLPIVTSANCLQPDGQNNNGWDQGLLFLNPSQVWLQPPGYVTRMLSRNYLPQVVRCAVSGADGVLDACATRSEDAKTVVLRVVNSSREPVTAKLHLSGFAADKPAVRVWELTGPPEAVNTAAKPFGIVPREGAWRKANGRADPVYTFSAFSLTTLRFSAASIK